jgi:leucyl aminopeptidase
MKINVRSASPTAADAEVVVIGVWLTTAKKGPTSSALDAVDHALGGTLGALMEAEEFSGKKDQILALSTLGKLRAKKVVLLGLGPKESPGDGEARAFSARAARAANSEHATSLAVAVPEGFEARLRALAEGIELGAYRFSKYLTGERVPKKSLASATLLLSRKGPADAKKQVDLGQRIAAGVNLSRDLSNEPPNVLHPEELAEAARKAGKDNKFKVAVFDHEEILKQGMLLIHAVGRGSTHGPRFVHMSYVPAKKAKKKICFVGKGITFDTGGISIKPAQGMGEMKHDMSGAANMVGLMACVAALKPNVEVHAVIAAAENMPDGNAYRPGDIWGSYDGKSVEIINTDAEGRLVLADALAYAAREIKPDIMIDNATLTGACVVALGTTCSAFYATNEDTANRFAGAVKAAGEQMWRMPLIEEYKEQLRSDVADIKHTGERWGGSITAALFLREFIGDVKNWVHVDIAGPASTEKAYGWHPKGATGHAVLTFLSLVDRYGR